jgi:pimeloyl-ACP methyl ester carboxylesterase
MKKIIKIGAKKGTIVFLHGNSSSNKVFESILNSSEIKQTMIAYDLPGHGESVEEHKNHQDFSYRFYKDALIKNINSIQGAVLLVGNSMGGHLAIEISKQIKNLKGLVIFGAPPVKKPINFEEAFMPVEALQTFFTEKPTDEAIEAAVNIAVYNKECITTIVNDFTKANPLVRKGIYDDIFGNNFEDEYTIFTTLEVPKYIIMGDVDPSVNPEYLKSVKNESEDNCTLIPFENCGHYPSLEKPDEFIETMSFITSKVF